MFRPDSQYQLSPDQQDLLLAALPSNQPSGANTSSLQTAVMTPSNKKDERSPAQKTGYRKSTDDHFSSAQTMASPVQFLKAADSPYLGFELDLDGDDLFDFESNGQLIGDFPGDETQVDVGDPHDKRKSIDDKDEDEDEGGGKRRESEGGTNKKPGRKPLTAEPTSKRKAQNRAAQRAFRERKEKHLKDLETKVEDLEKASRTANHQNGLLRAQVDRLQTELTEYRKRLSWISNNGQGWSPSLGSSAPGAAARKSVNSEQNDFRFQFPRFDNVPARPTFNDSHKINSSANHPTRASPFPSKPSNSWVPGVVGRKSLPNSSPKMPASSYGSTGNSPLNALGASPPVHGSQTFANNNNFDSLSGLFSPSILEGSLQASSGGYFLPNVVTHHNQASLQKSDQTSPTNRQYSTSSVANTESPTSSSESQQNGSSIGTTPEPSLNSPGSKPTEYGLNTISEENQPAKILGGPNITPGLDANSFSLFAQQNGGGFDPVLFADYRESQDAVASQDFGAFFNDAFPLPELGSPEHNFNDVVPSPAEPDLMAQVDAAQGGHEGFVSAEDTSKMLTCNKIWDRLQSMEKFRNGEIDIDSLCSDLRFKARCSEGSAVVHEKDVDKILDSAR